MNCQRQPFQTGVIANFAVAAAVGENLVPGAFQQFPLLVEDSVFPPRLLVHIVDEENLHLSV
jgi:hypothetical protein